MQKLYIKIGCLLFIFLAFGNHTKAQDVVNDFQSRTSIELEFKPLKKVKLSVIPEIRMDEKFSVDKFLFEGQLEYKPIKLLSLGAIYRFVGNTRTTKSTQYFNRYDFLATVKKDFGRFTPALRMRYSNYADDDVLDKKFMRYKASVKYDIPKSKITPFIGVEAFRDLTASELYKMRYSAGLDFKLFKKNFLGVAYKLDYYEQEFRNKHIICVGYKIKF